MALRAANFDMAPPECAGLPRRSFLAGGTTWVVCEHSDSHSGPALLFFAPGIARRVKAYPADWQQLPDEALYALSWEK